ncbi:MAG TPA: hypothetical protein VEJ86_02540 [Candidatus Binataceae bacterium]|nr:hypothetical protein [Candidatus Binataceae bacterium]
MNAPEAVDRLARERLIGSFPAASSARPAEATFAGLNKFVELDDEGPDTLYSDEPVDAPAVGRGGEFSNHILQAFVDDEELRNFHRVTVEEIERLSQSSFLGSITCKEDVVFMLRQIRAAKDEAIGIPQSFHDVTSRLRRDALARLAATTAAKAIMERRGLQRMVGWLSSTATLAFGLIIAIAIWRNRMLNSAAPVPFSAVAASHLPNLNDFQLLWVAELLLGTVVVIAARPAIRDFIATRRLKVRPESSRAEE